MEYQKVKQYQYPDCGIQVHQKTVMTQCLRGNQTDETEIER
jgi:hypothetical protein